MTQWSVYGPEDRLVLLLPPEAQLIQAHGLEPDEALATWMAMDIALRRREVTIEDRLRARCTKLGWWWRTRFMSFLKSVHEMSQDPEQFVPLVIAGMLWLPIVVVLLGGHLAVLFCLWVGIRPFNWPEGPEWPDQAITWAHGLVGHRWVKEDDWNEGQIPEGCKEWRPGAKRRVFLRCGVCQGRTNRLIPLGGNPQKCW